MIRASRPCRAEHAAFASQTGRRLKSPAGAFMASPPPSFSKRLFWYSFGAQKSTLLRNNSLFVGHPEQHKAHNKQHDQRADAHIGAAGQLAAHADDHGAQEGCPLAADVEQAEILARLLRRDDLGKVGAAERLHTALEHAHDEGQHPELPLLGQEERKQRDARIGRDADRDEGGGRILRRQPPEDERRRERHDLSHQQRQQQAGGVQPQRSAVGRSHVDDGVDAVDVAEERQQEPEHLLVLMQVAERVADAGKALPDGVFLHLHIMQLPVAFQQGQGHCQPPRRCDEERDVQRRHLAQADGPGPQHQRQADHKGHTAADVAPRIPAGGDYFQVLSIPFVVVCLTLAIRSRPLLGVVVKFQESPVYDLWNNHLLKSAPSFYSSDL